MQPDGFEQICRASIMQEEEPLAHVPQRRGAELVRPGIALGYTIRQRGTHVMQSKVGEWLVSKTTHAGERRLCRRQFVRVAKHAAYLVKHDLAIRRRWCKCNRHGNGVKT